MINVCIIVAYLCVSLYIEYAMNYNKWMNEKKQTNKQTKKKNFHAQLQIIFDYLNIIITCWQLCLQKLPTSRTMVKVGD